MQNAVEHLQAIDAFSPDETLTPLGEHLANLPLDPAVGKLLIMGAVFDCVEPVLSIAASLSYRSPFVMPLEKRGEADAARRRFAGGHRSDHWALLQVCFCLCLCLCCQRCCRLGPASVRLR